MQQNAPKRKYERKSPKVPKEKKERKSNKRKVKDKKRREDSFEDEEGEFDYEEKHPTSNHYDDSGEFSSEEEILRRMQPRKPGRPPTKFLAKMPVQKYSDETEDSGVDMSEEEDSDVGFIKSAKQGPAIKRKNSVAGDTPKLPGDPQTVRKSDRIGGRAVKKTYAPKKVSWESVSSDEGCYDSLLLDGARLYQPITPVIVTEKRLEKILGRRELKRPATVEEIGAGEKSGEAKKEEEAATEEPKPGALKQEEGDAMHVIVPQVAALPVRAGVGRPRKLQPTPPKEKLSAAILTPPSEFLVKWKARSYLHVEWVGQSVIDNAHMGRSRLQKFLAKESHQDITDLNETDVDDGQYFDSKYAID